MKIFYTTNIGLNRQKNEDSILVGNRIVSNKNYNEVKFETLELKETYFAVADGMGGYSFGEFASKKVLEILKDSKFLNEKSCEIVLGNIQTQIYETVLKQREYYGMGTVLSGIRVDKEKILVFNVGDSRTYRIHNNRIEFITKDNSLVYELYKKGKITFDEMRTHPNKNIVTSCYRATENNSINYEVKKFDTITGDRYFICSDGLWEMIESSKLEEVLCSEYWEKAIKNLLELALFNGGRDNISFILVEI